MGRTLLIGHPRVQWREWMKANRRGRPLLCLDPADPQQGVPGRLGLFQGEHPVSTRLYGSLDPQRAPHLFLAMLLQSLPTLGPEGIVQLFAFRPTPLLHQMILLLAQAIDPTEILVARGTSISLHGFPIGPSEVDIEDAFPPMVQHAQRKAQWLRLIENSAKHAIPFDSVTLDGTRLGAGTPLNHHERTKIGIPGLLHAEKCGPGLLLVVETEPSEGLVSRAMDATGCTKAHIVGPTEYNHLLCALVRPNGEEFGEGFIRHVDWAERIFHVESSAVPPAPVRILRCGSLRVDGAGREIGESKPWAV